MLIKFSQKEDKRSKKMCGTLTETRTSRPLRMHTRAISNAILDFSTPSGKRTPNVDMMWLQQIHLQQMGKTSPLFITLTLAPLPL